VKYIFIRKQKVVLCPKLKKNQREVAANALRRLGTLLGKERIIIKRESACCKMTQENPKKIFGS
jgi:hypothetical protein